MNIEELLALEDQELKQEYQKARRGNNLIYIAQINTIRIKKWLDKAVERYPNTPAEFLYYVDKDKTYFKPQYEEFKPTIKIFVEWQMLAHMNGRTPILVDIPLLKKLVASHLVSFKESIKRISVLDMENNINYSYETEDVIKINLPDIWVPNGEEELMVAVHDMPKEDAEALLLTDVCSYLIIGKYKTINPTFTDVFYCPNDKGDAHKAILLNAIAGIKKERLEQELQKQSVFYRKKKNYTSREDTKNLENYIPIDLDLSTIWTAKYKEIIEDAVVDSQENSLPDLEKVAEIYDTPCTIVAKIEEDQNSFSLRVKYNTVIIFDGKLILYEEEEEEKKSCQNIFRKYGIQTILKKEPINLTPFINSHSNIEKMERKR